MQLTPSFVVLAVLVLRSVTAAPTPLVTRSIEDIDARSLDTPAPVLAARELEQLDARGPVTPLSSITSTHSSSDGFTGFSHGLDSTMGHRSHDPLDHRLYGLHDPLDHRRHELDHELRHEEFKDIRRLELEDKLVRHKNHDLNQDLIAQSALHGMTSKERKALEDAHKKKLEEEKKKADAEKKKKEKKKADKKKKKDNRKDRKTKAKEAEAKKRKEAELKKKQEEEKRKKQKADAEKGKTATPTSTTSASKPTPTPLPGSVSHTGTLQAQLTHDKAFPLSTSALEDRRLARLNGLYGDDPHHLRMHEGMGIHHELMKERRHEHERERRLAALHSGFPGY